MIVYDSAVIYKFAERLYNRANSIVASYTLLGFLVGALAAYAATRGGSDNAVVFGGGLFAVLGYAIGSERAFALKLQAQTALCQAQIEENTRPDRAASVASHNYAPTPQSASRPAL